MIARPDPATVVLDLPWYGDTYLPTLGVDKIVLNLVYTVDERIWTARVDLDGVEAFAPIGVLRGTVSGGGVDEYWSCDAKADVRHVGPRTILHLSGRQPRSPSV